MKYQLEKKKGFFYLFKEEIIFLIIITLTLGIIYLIVSNWASITSFIATIFTYKTFWNYVNRFAILIYLMYVIVRATIYLYRHTYIPLTKEELEKNNIYTMKEYNLFLHKFFLGHSPVRKVREEIIKTAEKYILNIDINKEYCKLTKEDLYFLDKNGNNNRYFMYILEFLGISFMSVGVIGALISDEMSITSIYVFQFMIWIHLFFNIIGENLMQAQIYIKDN